MNSSNEERLAFYIPSLRGGGAERVTVNLLKGLAQMSLPIDLLLVKAEGPYLMDVPASVRVIDLQSSRVLASVPRLIRYLKTERPSVLVSAMVQSNIASLLARRLAGGSTKLMVVDHNTLSMASNQSVSRKESLMPFFARRLYPWADGIVAVSSGVADDLSRVTRINREKIHVIYNPVVRDEMFVSAGEEVAHPWLNDPAVPLIVAVGRLNRQKDFSTLLRAFAEVSKQRSVRLLILGEGDERNILETQIRELALDDCVSLPGFVTNPYAYLSRAQLFVLSSQWEGLPTVLIEALALGVPIVSTDCESGPREILAGGKYGGLVPVGDSSALAAQMLSALDQASPDIPREAWTAFTEAVAAQNYLSYIRGL